jgi:peptidoglycan/LPS O-acetylase OafA/YrhL
VKKIGILEAVRGFAATYVFAGHLLLSNFPETARWTILLRFGQEAVMIFFVLSGFVIMYSTETSSDKSFRTYIGRRFFRIYPIFLFALVLSYALSGKWSFELPSLIGNVFMLQDFGYGKPGVLFGPFEGNLPLWSLSYEWWFYLMFFPLYRFVAERMQLPIITAASVFAVVSYNATYFQPFLFIAYFPLWWTGVEIGRAIAHQQPIPFERIMLALGTVSATFGVYVIVGLANSHQLFFGIHPVLELRHALATTAIVGWLFVHRRFGIQRLDWLIKPFAAVAPISYGIYALHYPIVNSAFAISLPLVVRMPVIILAVLAVAWFAEIAYQRFVLRLRKLGRADKVIDAGIVA